MNSPKRGPGGLPLHQSWTFYFLFLLSLMAYNTWGCVTQGSGDDFHLRLHAGTTLTSGFVQYKNNGTWFRVCSLSWTSREAEAFCMSLGYLSFTGFNQNVTQAPDTHEVMYRTFATCKGNERCLDQCEGHQWTVVPRQGPTTSGVSECYLRPTREIGCSTEPPVTPTPDPQKPVFAIADNPMTPKYLEAPKAQQFASLQIATTTMSPIQLLAETFKCLVDPANCIFNVVTTTAAETTAESTIAMTQSTKLTTTTVKAAQALGVVDVTTLPPSTPSIPTTPSTVSTVSDSTTVDPTTVADTTVTNGTTPTTPASTTPTTTVSTRPSTTTKLTTPRTPTTTTTTAAPTTEAPAKPMPGFQPTSASSTTKKGGNTDETTSESETPTTPSTEKTTAHRESTTKPVFTTPFTGSTTTTVSSSVTTPSTKSPGGTTARPPIGVSPYGDNNKCPGFTGTYHMKSTTSGSIASPNYPNNYPASIRCQWMVRVNPGNVLRFSFDDFKIEQYDYVRIYDMDPNGKVIVQLSGDISDPNRIPVSNTTKRRRDLREKRATQDHVYTSSGDQAFVDFYSDDAHTDRGFTSSFAESKPGSSASTSKPNNNWIIIVVILLLLMFLIILLICIYCWWKNKKEKQNKCGFVIRDEKQLLYSKDGKMTVDPKSDYNAVAKSVESLFCVEGENDKSGLIEGYKDTIVVFDNPSYKKKNRVGSVASLEQKSDEIKQQMAQSLPDPPSRPGSRPGSGMRTPRPFVKDGVVMMLPKTNNYTPDEGEGNQGAPPSPDTNRPDETPRKKSLLSKDSKVAPLDPAGSSVRSTITMNPRSEATAGPEGVICANNKYSIVATVDGKKFGELDPVQSVPPDFLCPITNKMMKNPVMGSDGKSYERKAIVAWLAKKQTSPVTDQPMTEDSLKPNAALKSRIKQWKKQKEVTQDRADREASASHTSAIGDIDC